jgi:hypothetical protein
MMSGSTPPEAYEVATAVLHNHECPSRLCSSTTIGGVYGDAARAVVDAVVPIIRRQVVREWLRAEAEEVESPRVFTLPSLPKDVTVVRDNDGVIWHRAVESPYWETYSGAPPLIDETVLEVELWAAAPLTEVIREVSLDD